jgi:hypothetical protein
VCGAHLLAAAEVAEVSACLHRNFAQIHFPFSKYVLLSSSPPTAMTTPCLFHFNKLQVEDEDGSLKYF